MKNIIRSTAFLLVAAMVAGLAMLIPAQAADTSDLLALVDTYAPGSEVFSLSTESQFFVVSAAKPQGDLLQTVQLAQRQFAAAGKPTGVVLPIVWGPEEWAKDGDIVIKMTTGLADEAYQLAVGKKAVVSATDVDGLLYGMNMLLKHFRNAGEKLDIQGFTAGDAPDTKERTVMLDCGRKYYSAEWIKNFIREISWMGYNTLELHFSEDGGFRADFWDPAYYTDTYAPQNDFSWLCGSHVQSWVKDPYRTDPDAGKFLTTAELVEILQVAKEYHIAVIPSFDSPAHMDYITWKFEQNYKENPDYSFKFHGSTYNASSANGCINYTGKTGAATPSWPYYTTIDITYGTVARAFVMALYNDIADFFKTYAGSTDFSIGADEVNLDSKYSPKWSYSAFPSYVNALNNLLNGKGYTCRMFNDFIGSTTYNQSSAGKSIYDFADNIEIMYWDSGFNPTDGVYDDDIWKVDFFWDTQYGDGDRTIYNCIQTNTYYVLRVAASSTDYPNQDARNPENHNWVFYHSTERDIYNEWYPADISEKGVYSENTTDVPAANLGGAYFLIWNDYAALNTEVEVWNGVADNTGTSSYVYSLRNRMWSNIIKMWNSDINASLNYAGYEALRSQFGGFPGEVVSTVSTKAAVLPAAAAPTYAYLADHAELDKALANKKDSKIYSEDSYSLYLEAYEAAQSVHDDHGATQAQVDAAVESLKAAQAALKMANVRVVYQATTASGDIVELESVSYATEKATTAFRVYLTRRTGYVFDRVEGATYMPLPSDDGTGYIVGDISKANVVTVWYRCKPDTSPLDAMIAEAIQDTENPGFTADSWAVYTTALANAQALEITDSTTQDDVDRLVYALAAARSALVAQSEDRFITIEKLTPTARLGKQVGLRIVTGANVAELTVLDITNGMEGAVAEELTYCSGEVQTLNTGETVKVWLIRFPADVAGVFTYQIGSSENAATVEITVQ